MKASSPAQRWSGENCKRQQGFMMLQVLPALLATVLVVVTLLTCYGRCVQTQVRHNRILQAQAAGEKYYVTRETEILQEAQLYCREQMVPLANGAFLHELRLFDKKGDRLLVNVLHVEGDER